MTKRDIGKEIIEGLEEIKAWRRGEKKLRTITVELPKAAGVPAIRKELGLSQQQFARFMGVSVATLRNWEQGRREPRGPARSLLLIASMEPTAVLKAFMAGGQGQVGAAQKVAHYRVSRRWISSILARLSMIALSRSSARSRSLKSPSFPHRRHHDLRHGLLVRSL